MSVNVPLSHELLVGIFVGGESSRMGSPKGLLTAPMLADATEGRGTNLVERLLRISEKDLGLSTVLVGSRPEYGYLGRTTVLDKVPGCGPLGGLVGLLEYGERIDKTYVVALACDLPYLGGNLLKKLAFFPRPVRAVCVQSDSGYEPLFARYHTNCAALMQQALNQQRLSLQPMLRALNAESLSVDSAERKELVDWDSPDDLGRS